MTRRSFGVTFAAAASRALSQQSGAGDFHVSPEAGDAGDGTPAKPWSLGRALSAVDLIRPGATVWLHGGAYTGHFDCRLAGSEEKPIVIRPYPGHAVLIDAKGESAGALVVSGPWTVFRDLEITDSDPDRTATRPPGVSVLGPHTNLVNLVIHDCGIGIGFWTNCLGPAAVYGCLIYHNGWQGAPPDRGHGHAIYSQNREGIKRLADNIMFNQFSFGIHAYGTQAAFLKGFDIEGNISFNNGSLSRGRAFTSNILVGGDTPAEHIVLRENLTYFDKPGNSIRLGYNAANRDAIVHDNYIVGTAQIELWEKMEFTRNTVVSGGPLLRLSESPASPAAGPWEDNNYVQLDAQRSPFEISKAGWNFAQWRQRGHRDAHSRLRSGRPDGPRVFVRPNRYEPGRAHVAVCNWDGASAVPVDLAGVLHSGQSFEVLCAQDYFGAPALRGVYSGKPVQLPMTPRTPTQPVGVVPCPPGPTGPEFEVFVVRSVQPI